MANTNIQFYTDTRTVFSTSDRQGKTSIGSANGTVQGLEIEYNLGVTGANEAFKISPSGINYTKGITGATGAINYTTPLARIAQVGSLIESLKTPPDATTLQVDKRILLNDGVSTGSIGISGVNTQVTSSGNLILDPVTNIVDLSGNTLDMGGGNIIDCPLIQSVNNNDITVEGRGTGDVILKTGSTNRLTISETGAMTFQGSNGDMVYNNATNTLTAANFSGTVTKVSLSDNNTDAVFYPVFASGTGIQSLLVDNDTGPFAFNPSTNTLTATNFKGTATNATNTGITANNTDGTFYPTFVSDTSGNLPQLVDTTFSYNPSTTTLTAAKFDGTAAKASLTNNNNIGTFYPVFAAGAGSQSLFVDNDTGPFSINPSNGAFRLSNTMKVADSIVAFGNDAGLTNQDTNTVAIGFQAGATTQGTSAVAIGNQAGVTTQGPSAVAIGHLAGNNNQGDSAVAIGNEAGATGQRPIAVSIGVLAGNNNQGDAAVSIGNEAGQISQRPLAVAIGNQAGETNQKAGAVAIGNKAGQGLISGQGINAIAIGNLTRVNFQTDGTIYINASGGVIGGSGDLAGLFIKPIRPRPLTLNTINVGLNVLRYTPGSGEITYSTPISIV